MTREAGRPARPWYVAGTVVATGVALVFMTVGDGVPPAESDGLHGIVVDHGHWLTWICLALALGLAAVRGRWNAWSQGFAMAAGVLYAAFLLTVFVLAPATA